MASLNFSDPIWSLEFHLHVGIEFMALRFVKVGRPMMAFYEEAPSTT